jgi:hypothetical protein
MSELGQLVLDLLAYLGGEEGEALQKTLHVRIGACVGQVFTELGIELGELPPDLPQIIQLVLKQRTHEPISVVLSALWRPAC